MNNQPIMQNQLHRKLFKSSIKREDVQLAGGKLTFKTFSAWFLRASYRGAALGEWGDTSAMLSPCPEDRQRYTKPKAYSASSPQLFLQVLWRKKRPYNEGRSYRKDQIFPGGT